MTQRVRAGLRIPYGINTKLIKISQSKGISKNAVILQAIDEYLQRNKIL